MRFFLKSLAALVVGVVLGLVLTWVTVWRGAGFGDDVTDGPWHTSLLAGSVQGGPYLRAGIAVHGLLALNRSETIYYSATTDSAGDRLTGNCVYRLTGRDPPTRWWSVTAYGADDFLIPNRNALYSVSQNSVLRGADGGFVITVSRDAAGRNQIASGDGAFSLSVRLYNPDPSVVADPVHVALPAIEKVSCR